MAYTLAPPPYLTVLDTAGTPVANACIWTYVAGTTTPAATYSDALGTVNTNPIRADAAGRFTAYLTPGAGYKFVMETPCSPPSGHGAVIRTADNLVGTLAAPAVSNGAWLPGLGGTATYSSQEGTWVRIGPLVFARGTLTVLAIGTGSPTYVNGLPFPVLGDTAGSVILGGAGGAAVAYTSLNAYAISGESRVGFAGLLTPGTTADYHAVIGNGSSVTVSLVYQTTAP